MWSILKVTTCVFLIFLGLLFAYQKFKLSDQTAMAFSICRQVSVAVSVYREINSENPQTISDLVESNVISEDNLNGWKTDLTSSLDSTIIESETYIFLIEQPENSGSFIGVTKNGNIVSFRDP